METAVTRATEKAPATLDEVLRPHQSDTYIYRKKLLLVLFDREKGTAHTVHHHFKEKGSTFLSES